MSLQKKLTIGFLSLAVFLAASLVFLSTKYVAPILMYHSVSDRPFENEELLTVSIKSFERQVRFLKLLRYNVVRLEELAAMIRDKKRIPAKTVVLTFDDGRRDVFTNAFPILLKYRMPATVFVIVREVGRPKGDRLSWEEIKKMQASGLVSIGSHCLGPEPLVNIKSSEELKREIFGSKSELESALGVPVNTFSYPEGRFNAAIRQMVIEAGYNAAVATNPGKSFSNTDIFALKRIRISRSCDSLWTFFIESSGYYNFMREHRRK